MDDIPRLSSKERLVLELLINQGEMYGLEMVEASQALKRGTIYVTLRRMAEKGYVESRQEERASGIPKRVFRISGHGQRVFKAWEVAGAQLGLGTV